MPAPITFYVDVNAILATGGVAGADFNVPIFLNTNSVAGSVLQGPYSSPQDVLDAGFASGSAMHNFAVAVAQQQKRPATFYSGKVATTYAQAFTDALAVNPGAFYGIAMQSRATNDILAVAALVEAENKLAIFQSSEPSMLDDTNGLEFTATVGGTAADGNYDLIFTGFGLPSPVTLRVARSTTPATNDDLAAAIDAALDTEAAALGDLVGIVVPLSISTAANVVSFATTDGLIGTVTSAAPAPGTLTVAVTDGDVASQLFALQYSRSSLWYYGTDATLMAERVLARCFGNDLDTQQLSWSYKKLVGVAGSVLNGTQVTKLRATNSNYYTTTVTSAGQESVAFTSPGWVSSGASGAGLPIRATTSMDWMVAKIEERNLNMFLREPNAVWMDDEGINRADASTRSVFTDGLAADHFIERVVPDGEEFAGLETPELIMPKASEISTEDREAGLLTYTAVAYLKPSMEKIVANVTVRQ